MRQDDGMPILDKDMTLCISVASRPSNLGTRFHNFLYDELSLPFVYKAFAPVDIGQTIAGIRGLGIRGCSVSMPFKEAVIPLVDEMTESAAAIDSVNTIVNTDGRLVAYNTDYTAVRKLVEESGTSPSSALVQGSGGMAKAVVAALHDCGVARITVRSRNGATGSQLAKRYSAEWVPESVQVQADLLVNATPIGMAGGDAEDDLPFARELIEAADSVLDVVAIPAETPLLRAARAASKRVMTGVEVTALQAADQFELYTGVRPTADQVQRAAAFSRS